MERTDLQRELQRRYWWGWLHVKVPGCWSSKWIYSWSDWCWIPWHLLNTCRGSRTAYCESAVTKLITHNYCHTDSDHHWPPDMSIWEPREIGGMLAIWSETGLKSEVWRHTKSILLCKNNIWSIKHKGFDKWSMLQMYHALESLHETFDLIG